MNRQQKRAAKLRQKAKFKELDNSIPDYSDVPLATMCQGIQLLINELNNRGIRIRDFDNKDKYVQQVQIIRGQVYFLAAEEISDEG